MKSPNEAFAPCDDRKGTEVTGGANKADVGTNAIVQMHLTQGKVTLIDLADWLLVRDHRWYAAELYPGRWYAQTNIRKSDRRRVTLQLSRLILMPVPDHEVDHRNGETLDNRRCNLRVCTRIENARNRRLNEGRRFKGVYWNGGNWLARIYVDSRMRTLGSFGDPAEAAHAYDAAAHKHFGEFARPNFPEVERAGAR